ncbi:MAG: class I SAM-dependent methyltransferase [Egibacteraceae bacterium]
MTKDWQQWHRHYDTPESSLVQRLNAVRRDLRRALADAQCDADGVVRLLSICSGEGRDVLPVLAERERYHQVRALLVELDPVLAQRASKTAAELGLSGVEVRRADAGTIDTYADVPAVQVLLVCGVFGNISMDDVHRTIATLPALLAAGGIVIWTRGAENTNRDRSQDIRAWFAEHRFMEVSFTSTEDGVFRVGMHQLPAERADLRIPQPGTRMFTFA